MLVPRVWPSLWVWSRNLPPSFGMGKLFDYFRRIYELYLFLGKCSLSLSSRPMGVFEYENFAHGSKAVLDAVVMSTEKGATSIIGMTVT